MKRREVFGESHEGRAVSYHSEPLGTEAILPHGCTRMHTDDSFENCFFFLLLGWELMKVGVRATVQSEEKYETGVASPSLWLKGGTRKQWRLVCYLGPGMMRQGE